MSKTIFLAIAFLRVLPVAVSINHSTPFYEHPSIIICPGRSFTNQGVEWGERRKREEIVSHGSNLRWRMGKAGLKFLLFCIDCIGLSYLPLATELV
ncbi:hypothetical protein EDB80DRAFT_25587 [Ilyonectria destructans]|nr:hypothetical protein EDB80DRAFT_25587 [Ilyonectria destructans]